MPLLLIAFFIADLISFAYPIIGYFLWREWDHYRGTTEDGYAHRCLYGAIVIAMFIFLGKFLMKALISRKRKNENETHLFKARKSDSLKRPDGSVIHLEYYGKEKAQAIIFVHGLNASSKNWYYQRTYFEKDYYLILMDLPGMGKSKRPIS